MSKWTDSAEQAFQEHLSRTRARLEASGADPDEVAGDLRRHIDEEATAAKLPVVARQDVERILGRIGALAAGDAPAAAPAGNPSTLDLTKGRKSGVGRSISTAGLCFGIVFGVLLPLATLAVEYFTGMCNSTLFDPIPTPFHIVLVLCVPVANGMVLMALSRSRTAIPRTLGVLSALAAGIAFYYSIIFLPFTPFAVIGILAFGMGLLPLSPLLSFIVALATRPALCRLGGIRLFPVWLGIAIAFALVVALDTPKLATQIGIHMAASRDQATSNAGVRMLRKVGSLDTLLRQCYVGNRFASDVVGAVCSLCANPVPPEQVRDIYYRVTGTPYNAVKPPKITGLRGGAMVNDNEFDFDRGGDAVASRIRGLALSDSRIDGKLDADQGWCYTEWTLVIRNDARQQHEARAELVLPAGGVVSRLTLWINGEEREAAFGSREQVKTAYTQVVERRRDPVLVTTCGKDRVLLQCFPVPPNGGTMKVRVGITAPLLLVSRHEAVCDVPRFAQCNFDLSFYNLHSIWFESKNELFAPGMIYEDVKDGGTAVRNLLPNFVLDNGMSVHARRNPEVTTVWTRGLRATNEAICQAIEEHAATKLQRVAVVIDGSSRMNSHRDAAAHVLNALPEGVERAILFAGDRCNEVSDLTSLRFVGGCDNVPALERAWDFAAAQSNSAIIWLHATQPIELGATGTLEQRWFRRPDGPVLYDIQFGGGPNVVAAKLDQVTAVVRLAGTTNGTDRLAQLKDEWRGAAPHLEFKRWRADNAVTNGTEADAHIARLWAHDHAMELGASRKKAKRDQAVELSQRYQLVTPMSGAVVLETAEQFKAAGLEPVDAETTPQVVPEPCATGMIIIAAGLLLARRKHTEKSRPEVAPTFPARA